MDLSGLRKDIEEGIKQGVDAVKSTATLVKEKAEELTEKGKTQYRIFELKSKKQRQHSGLGEKLRELVKSGKVKVSNEDLKKLLSALDKTDEAISKLEGKTPAKTATKTATKTNSSKKKKVGVKKTAAV